MEDPTCPGGRGPGQDAMIQRMLKTIEEQHRRELELVESIADMKEHHQAEMERMREHYEQEVQNVEDEVAKNFEKECVEKMREIDQDVQEYVKECHSKMADEKAEMEREMAALRADHDKQKDEMERRTETEMLALRSEHDKQKSEMERRILETRLESERLAQEKQELISDVERFRDECARKMQEEKAEMTKKMEAEKEVVVKRLAREKEDMEKDTKEFREACEGVLAEQKQIMANEKRSAQAEIDRMAKEKEGMERKMVEFRADFEAKMEAERKAMEMQMEQAKTKMAEKLSAVKAQCDEEVVLKRAEMERQLADARDHTEALLKAEREMTDNVRHALRELPPLQAAMEFGDLKLLEEEMQKWQGEVPQRFGECKGVVEAMVNLARERFLTWRNVSHTVKDILREVGSNENVPQDACHKLFRTLKEAQLTKMDLQRSDRDTVERMTEVFLRWQEKAMLNSNSVQKAIIGKVLTWPNLGPFDFVDLDICLRLVDRDDQGNEVFLSRAKALITDSTTAPKNMRPTLSHLETMLFYLKYTKSEDLRLTHAEFLKANSVPDPVVAHYLRRAEQRYSPGKELVRFDERLKVEDIERVLQELRRPSSTKLPDDMGFFREIFYQWAVAMKAKFELLVLPHHTQVVCLLVFQFFLESQKTSVSPHSLIAQVGTGEGKSMIVAALAIYCVVMLNKKVHVVVDDETLLERDFETFKPLFDIFEVRENGHVGRKVHSVLCVRPERIKADRSKDSCLSERIDPDADICYCEAKHVQSYYTSIARSEKPDFSTYENRILILDEVDALVIDEEPNEPYVYSNKELSEMASAVARSLARGRTQSVVAEEFSRSPHPAAPRVVREVCAEWERGKQLRQGEDFVFSKDDGKYCKLRGGRADNKAWSLALECRNFQDELSREVVFKERLFVMSRPRVFKKYDRILGLSGSIGSDSERKFLKETYKVAFFEVPPFLKTCTGSPFHEPVPQRLGERKQFVYVEKDDEMQVTRVAEIALEQRERVPVLVIARDRAHADYILEGLKTVARKRGLGSATHDIIRLLSRSLYEADPEQWKENLNRSTLPLGERTRGSKTWRITVTDPRGARGTDYRVDDPDVDSLGGLLLIPTLVPASQRDWKQFLGRTARQDRRGQFCAVLSAVQYEKLSAKYKQALPQSGGLEIINNILSWADKEVAERIKGTAALYNSGVRLNEICEDIFGNRQDILQDNSAREILVDICQKLRYMSVREIDEAFARYPSIDPKMIPTEARDMGRPEEPPVSTQTIATGTRTGMLQTGKSGPKVVVFCIDWSVSMKSEDCGNGLSRFGTCVKCMQRILRDQVREHDILSLVAFGSSVQTVFPPIKKGDAGPRLATTIAGMRPDHQGGTCFFDAVECCLQMLAAPGTLGADAQRWLICLTDGDDLGSKRDRDGRLVSSILDAGRVPKLNMAMITVGRLKDKNLQLIGSWVEKVARAGGFGRHMSEKDASSITKAFEVVAECLALGEVGGATEC